MDFHVRLANECAERGARKILATDGDLDLGAVAIVLRGAIREFCEEVAAMERRLHPMRQAVEPPEELRPECVLGKCQTCGDGNGGGGS